jgi:hypothetical protein
VVPTGYSVVNEEVLTYLSTNEEIEISLKNVGVESTAGPLTVTISSNDQQLTINSNTATCMAINPDGTAVVNFNVTVDNGISNGKIFPVTVSSTDGNHSWESPISLKAYKPVLIYKERTWQGGFSAGETFNFCVAFENKGGARLNNTTFSLNTENAGVTINNNNVYVGTIAPNGKGFGVFNVTLADDIDETEPITFTTVATGDNGLITADGEFTLENSCMIKIEMTDTYGDGWNGSRISIRKDNVEIKSVTLPSGSSGTEECMLPAGTLTFYWVSGSTWDYECRFKIYNHANELIFNQSTTPTAGLFFTYDNQCASEAGGCQEITDLEITREGNTVDLVWDGTAESYIVLRDGIVLDEVIETYYTDNYALNYEHTYCVIARHSDCDAFPICDNVSPVPVLCNPPVSLQADTLGNSVILTWFEPEKDGILLGYIIYRNETPLNEEPYEGTEYTDENLEDDTYIYKVSAVYAHCDESDLSDEVSVTINTVGISEFQTSLFHIFPNPAKNELNITGTVTPSYVSIYNLMGQTMYETNQGSINMKISVTHLSAGIYFIRIDSKEGSVTKKVVIWE